MQISGIKNELTDVATKPNRAEYYVEKVTWIQWLTADGVASRTQTVSLARNALVRKYTMTVGAKRADRTSLDNAGQVRLQGDSGGVKTIVVDFGMLRTVSGIGRSDADGVPHPTMCITSVRAFKGDGFGPSELYSEGCSDIAVTEAIIEAAQAPTFEAQTDRVRIKVKSDASLTDISAAIFLVFPDLPSDLDIRIGGGAPAWTASGVAQPNTRGWDAQTRQIADLTGALAALSGDPHDETPFDASIVLSSRIPASLTLDQLSFDVAYLSRITFGSVEEQTIVLDQEGEYELTLNVPSWAAGIQEVRFTATGTIPVERILEPVGPPIATASGTDGAAFDQLLDVDHAAAARLTLASAFAELTAVRLPLRAGADGAEARVVLYSGNDDGPVTPVDGGTSTPVDLPPATDASDHWTSFAMARGVKLDATKSYWAVVVVGRGSAVWSLGSFASAATAVPIRRGAPNGPWHGLPNVLGPDAGLGARIRIVGKAPPTAAIAPLMVTVVGQENSQLAVTPTAKGASFVWLPIGTGVHPTFAPSGQSIRLRLTSRIAGQVKLSAIDVVAIKPT